MRGVLVVFGLCILFSACATQSRVMREPIVEVTCVSPGENGLCTYYLRGTENSNIKGRIILIDTNDKYKLGDTFRFPVKNPKTN